MSCLVSQSINQFHEVSVHQVVDARPAMREAVVAALARRLARIPADDSSGGGERRMIPFRVLHLRFHTQAFATVGSVPRPPTGSVLAPPTYSGFSITCDLKSWTPPPFTTRLLPRCILSLNPTT